MKNYSLKQILVFVDLFKNRCVYDKKSSYYNALFHKKPYLLSQTTFNQILYYIKIYITHILPEKLNIHNLEIRCLNIDKLKHIPAPNYNEYIIVDGNKIRQCPQSIDPCVYEIVLDDLCLYIDTFK